MGSLIYDVMSKYGKLTTDASGIRKELEIKEFLKARFKDDRLTSICELEDDSFVLAVENPQSSGRASQATIWLSRESLIGLISTSIFYFSSKGEDMELLLKDAIQGDDVSLSFSENIEAMVRKNNTIT